MQLLGHIADGALQQEHALAVQGRHDLHLFVLGQPLHRHIGRDIHSDIRQKWQKLPAQKSGTDHFLTKSFSEDENVVCDT